MAISNTNRGEGGLISYEKSRRFFIRKGISLGDRTQGIKKYLSGFEIDATEIDFDSSKSSVNAIISRKPYVIQKIAKNTEATRKRKKVMKVEQVDKVPISDINESAEAIQEMFDKK